MDIVGPFPISTGQRKFLLVAVDYFSKWEEAEPLAKITEKEVLSFLWKKIVCRFGIPRRLVSDNERKLCGDKVRAWCQELKIEQVFTSVAYPQGNGQVEVTNRTMVQAFKTRLDTTIGSGTGETPFNMVYGTEAVLPAEVGHESARIMAYGENNQDLRAMNLDLVEKNRVRAAISGETVVRRLFGARNDGDRMPRETLAAGDVNVVRAAADDYLGVKLKSEWRLTEIEMMGRSRHCGLVSVRRERRTDRTAAAFVLYRRRKERVICDGEDDDR
ncbi:uncharacterized protein [Henckelia pumila]|uniref:uncharacterized protein n=1 Tax=Henckelia pumila TaxID=405737 RepID=UPI003C6E0B49